MSKDSRSVFPNIPLYVGPQRNNSFGIYPPNIKPNQFDIANQVENINTKQHNNSSEALLDIKFRALENQLSLFADRIKVLEANQENFIATLDGLHGVIGKIYAQMGNNRSAPAPRENIDQIVHRAAGNDLRMSPRDRERMPPRDGELRGRERMMPTRDSEMLPRGRERMAPPRDSEMLPRDRERMVPPRDRERMMPPRDRRVDRDTRDREFRDMGPRDNYDDDRFQRRR